MAYIPGEHYVECQRCGFRKYASECRREWTGFFVCKDCYDHKPDSLIPHVLPPEQNTVREIHLPKDYFIEPEE